MYQLLLPLGYMHRTCVVQNSLQLSIQCLTVLAQQLQCGQTILWTKQTATKSAAENSEAGRSGETWDECLTEEIGFSCAG